MRPSIPCSPPHAGSMRDGFGQTRWQRPAERRRNRINSRLTLTRLLLTAHRLPAYPPPPTFVYLAFPLSGDGSMLYPWRTPTTTLAAGLVLCLGACNRSAPGSSRTGTASDTAALADSAAVYEKG